MNRPHALVAIVLSVGAAAVGCGGAPVPNAQVTSSAAAVRAAQELGAKNEPQAALYLHLAQEKREKALALINEGENLEARRLLERAEADAEVAVALAIAQDTREQALKAQQEVQRMREGL